MRIEFVRLTEVPLAAVVDLINEPRNARHMPLAGTFTEEAAAEWVSGQGRPVGEQRLRAVGGPGGR